jgi:hypothetical protein
MEMSLSCTTGYVEQGQPREFRFLFPAPGRRREPVLADNFASAASGKMDTVAFQVGHVGEAATLV